MRRKTNSLALVATVCVATGVFATTADAQTVVRSGPGGRGSAVTSGTATGGVTGGTGMAGASAGNAGVGNASPGSTGRAGIGNAGTGNAGTGSAVAGGPGAAGAGAAGAVMGDTGKGMTLDAVLQAANGGNIDVLNARLAVDTANASLRSARVAPNPVFSTNLLQVRPSQVGRLGYPKLVDSIVRVDVPLERGGKRQAREGAARASITAAEGDLGDARRQIRVAVTGAYFDLKAAEARAATLRTIAEAYAEGQRIATRQQRAGAISNGDLARQRVEALRADTEARAAASALREAQLALAILIGQEATTQALVTTGDWPAPVAGRAEPADSIAARRPDVLAAQARVEAARRNLDGAHALRHPDITVGAQYERADGDVGVGNSVGVGFAIPLPVRNLYRGEVAAASAAVTQAEARARKVEAVATAEILVARQRLAEATERRRLFEDAELPAARKAASVAEFAFRNGAITLLDLLDARRSLQTVELTAIDAHADEARAIEQLNAAETTADDAPRAVTQNDAQTTGVN